MLSRIRLFVIGTMSILVLVSTISAGCQALMPTAGNEVAPSSAVVNQGISDSPEESDEALNLTANDSDTVEGESAQPAELIAPILVSPSNGSSLDVREIQFEWMWAGELEGNQAFEVRGWLEGDPHNGLHDAEDTRGAKPDARGVYTLRMGYPAQFKGKTWLWTVAVVQVPDGDRIGVEAEPYRINAHQPKSPL